jgi:hypothetical protein
LGIAINKIRRVVLFGTKTRLNHISTVLGDSSGRFSEIMIYAALPLEDVGRFSAISAASKSE